MHRRSLLLSASAALAAPAIAQPAKTLRVIPQANLTSLDPIWTTAVVTRNHAYLVYDQLLAMDSNFIPRPAMAEGCVQDAAGLEWTLTLREGLRFHDNEPVRSNDCIASIRRWMARDSLGQSIALLTTSLEAIDDRRFRFKLSKPFPLLPAALAKPSPVPLFIFPERLAKTDPFKQITDPTGSGPFRFLPNEWNPGSRAVWARFDAYKPAPGAPDGIAGARVPNLDRVEWTIISDSATAAAALSSGEQDYWEYPIHDLLPLLRRNKDVVIGQRLSQGTYAGMRVNHLHPPFDNPAIRRALLLGIDQRDHLRAVAGDDTTLWSNCESVYACGTAYGTDAGNEPLRTRNIAKAKQALREAGYANQRTVLLAPSDYPQINALSLVTADVMTKMGFNLDLVSTDWGTVTQRRASPGTHRTRRMERLPQHLVRRRRRQSRHPPEPPHQRQRRLVRLANRPGHRENAQRLDRRCRRTRTQTPRRRNPGPGHAIRPLHPPRLLLATLRLAPQRNRRPPLPGHNLLEHD